MYRRFLCNQDYTSIITEEALLQLTRGDEKKFEQAEQAAEATIVDYLSDNYEIERELWIGKRIMPYNRGISYPVGVHFSLEGEICETLQAINGFQSPTDIQYWHEYEGLIEVETLPTYSQLKNYQPEDMVQFIGNTYVCDHVNGIDLNDIRIPGSVVWEEVECEDWEARPYNLWNVVRYNGKFFALITIDGFDQIVNPMDSECWGLIGEYDNSLDSYEISPTEYVVYNNKVYYPIANPNADKPELNKNYRHHDPRNYNLKRHMVQLALYELHKLISPNNISQVRVDDYDHTLLWLKDASRLKLNPQIPRKLDRERKPIMDWQLATFQTQYNPYDNPWHI